MAVKRDCFAYKCNNYCSALIVMVCNKRKCSFYKTKEQFMRDAERARKINEEKQMRRNDLLTK